MTGPTKLWLHKDGVDARKRTLSKNFSVRDGILPFDAENLPDRPYESSLASLYAWSLQRLKTEPSVRYQMSIPLSESLNASNSNSKNIILKRVGTKIHPCLTSFVSGKATELSQLSCTLACIPSWNCLTMVMNFSEQPYYAMILKRPSLRWPRQMPWSDQHKPSRGQCSFPDTSLVANTKSTVPCSLWKPYWLSVKSSCLRWLLRRFRRTLARILLKIEGKEIPRWLSHACQFPSCL